MSRLTEGIFGLSTLAAPSEAHVVGMLRLAAEFGLVSLGQRAEQGGIHLGSLSDFGLAGIVELRLVEWDRPERSLVEGPERAGGRSSTSSRFN